MKKLFVSIRRGELETVKELIARKPALISCVAKQPPKKDDGQSPLQVALKTGQFDIADFLIEQGADVNFIEQQSVNEWRAPAIHDAIRAAIMSSRYPMSYGECNTQARFERAYSTLEKMIEYGAEMRAQDSYGNHCLTRACLDARQFNWEKDASELKQMVEDLQKVFELLIRHGADIHEKTATRDAVVVAYGHEPIARLFN